MKGELEVIEQPQPTSVSLNPLQLVQTAVESNADIDKLERLMGLQERWEKQNSRKRFLEAMAEFQRTCPDILKLKKAHNSSYAPLGDIVAQIREPLADCGLSYRFEQDHNNGITVKCIVSHLDGHSETTQMTAGADTSGSKNAIQAIASTVTYLSRYTLTAALGIVTADADLDGRLPQDTSMVANADQKILEVMSSRNQTEADFFVWASKVLKKNVNSFDDISEEQTQWFLRKLEGKK